MSWNDLFVNMGNTNFFNFSFLPKYAGAFVRGFEYTLLLAVVSVELIRVYGQLDSAKSQREAMSQELEQQKKENSALESDLSKAGDEEFIKGLAKDQLGLAEDGERIFYDVNH